MAGEMDSRVYENDTACLLFRRIEIVFNAR